MEPVYTLAVEETVDELTEKVNELVGRGFRPVGGIAVQSVEHRNERKGTVERETWYYQAMFHPGGA